VIGPIDEPPLKDPSLRDTAFVVVDVETSGLNPRRHRVLQIALVTCYGDGRIIDSWSTYVHLGFLRRVGPRRIHGITRAILREAPHFAEVTAELQQRTAGATVVGHNVEFDWAFLAAEHRRARRPLPDVRLLDTLELSRSADPERAQRHRLVDVAERAGLAFAHRHDALADAEATAAVLPDLFARAGVASLEDLARVVQR
jgi:DNA polymerase-3 subunit epsilon